MKIATEPIVITYPFTDEIAYRCHYGKMLRKSNMHNRIYVVSELDINEIRTSALHRHGKDLSKK